MNSCTGSYKIWYNTMIMYISKWRMICHRLSKSGKFTSYTTPSTLGISINSIWKGPVQYSKIYYIRPFNSSTSSSLCKHNQQNSHKFDPTNSFPKSGVIKDYFFVNAALRINQETSKEHTLRIRIPELWDSQRFHLFQSPLSTQIKKPTENSKPT